MSTGFASGDVKRTDTVFMSFTNADACILCLFTWLVAVAWTTFIEIPMIGWLGGLLAYAPVTDEEVMAKHTEFTEKPDAEKPIVPE